MKVLRFQVPRLKIPGLRFGGFRLSCKLPVPLLSRSIALQVDLSTCTHTTSNNTPKQRATIETEREMPKLSSSSCLSWPGPMALHRCTPALLLLAFGLVAVVWQSGGGEPGAGLEGGGSCPTKWWLLRFL